MQSFWTVEPITRFCAVLHRKTFFTMCNLKNIPLTVEVDPVLSKCAAVVCTAGFAVSVVGCPVQAKTIIEYFFHTMLVILNVIKESISNTAEHQFLYQSSTK